MECPSCGAKFYSSAWHEMLEEGERCECGAELREAVADGATAPPQATMSAAPAPIPPR
jgi:hypothetical protein